jgi:hypothetical protein
MIFDDSASHGMFVLELGGRGKRLPEIDSLDADHPVSGEREEVGGIWLLVSAGLRLERGASWYFQPREFQNTRST